MRALYLCLMLSIGAISSDAQVVNIPDANFLKALIDHRPMVDQNGDGMIQMSEAELVDSLYIRNKSIADLTGIEAFTALKILDCGWNDLTSLDMIENPNLVRLSCGNNSLTMLDVTQNPNLEWLDCGWNALTTLDVSKNPNLEELYCIGNSLTTLDVSKNPNLVRLSCGNNSLTMLDVTQNPNLEYLSCGNNDLTLLDVTQNPNLEWLYCTDNSLTMLDVTQNPNLDYLYCSSNDLMTLDVTQNPNLEGLWCTENALTSLDVTKNPTLEFLDCAANDLTSLDVTQNPNLGGLSCTSNHLTSLDVTQNPNLNGLDCSGNSLTSLDVTQNPHLKGLYCTDNSLTTLDVTQNPILGDLYCDSNDLTTLDVTMNLKLRRLHCGDNNLSSLDVSNHPLLTKERNFFDGLQLSYKDSIRYICAHPDNLAEIHRELELRRLAETVVSLFCDFDDLLAYRPIVALGDDCSAAEYGDQVPMRVIIGMDTVDLFYTGMSDLYLPETADTIYIYPTSVDMSLYTLIEEVIVLDPSTLASGLNADSIYLDTLCAEVHISAYDVVTHLIPVDVPRPGFEVDYKLIYENRGTQSVSGSVGMGFDSVVLDYVGASVIADQDLGDSLTWDYVDLRPFERREIIITMRLNSPMDTPPLNDGDVLTYHVCASPITDDYQPDNNCTTLAQTVRNAYDPNDKRCMQGATLTPDRVGTYLTYMIRFENTGSAEAVNIRITDQIDTNVFDISTLTPVDASHPYHIEIHKGHEVHFVFPNIYLPFDDANNDGYVTFSIRSKEHLALGDKLENSASIFFDYNFPIFTNTATTEVADFVSTFTPDRPSVGVSLYPNPSSDAVQISTTSAIHHVILYDATGRIHHQQNYDGSQRTVRLPLHSMPSGIYHVEVHTTEGRGVGQLTVKTK